MAEKNGTPVEIYSEDIETLIYTFDQVQKAFEDVIKPDMINIKDDESPNSLKMIVKNNIQIINNLVNKLGAGDINFNDNNVKDIQTAVLKLWDWYKSYNKEDEASMNSKVEALMNIIGIQPVNKDEFIETGDPNSLLYLIAYAIGAKPKEGLLAKRFPKKDFRFGTKEYKEESIEDKDKNKFITFFEVPVEAEKTYTISLPEEKLYSLWYLKKYVDEKGSSYVDVIDGDIKTVAKVIEFTPPKGTEMISITFQLDNFNNSTIIENIVIKEKNVLLNKNLLEELIKYEDFPWNGEKELEPDKIIKINKNNNWQKILILNSKLREDKESELWLKQVPYRLIQTSNQEEDNTILHIPVKEMKNYRIEATDGAYPKTIYFLKLNPIDGNFESYEEIGPLICSKYQQHFWTRPGTTHISFTFNGDSRSISLYEEEAEEDNLLFREKAEQDFSTGGTFSLNKDWADGNVGNQLYNGLKFQAIKGLDYDKINFDPANKLRTADINSEYNFYLNPAGNDQSIYEVKITKTGYYLISGQLSFEFMETEEDPNAKIKTLDSPVDLQAAIMLKNMDEIPYRPEFYNYNITHNHETLLAFSNLIIPAEAVNGSPKVYRASVAITPKIVLLKEGDFIYLKGSFKGGWYTEGKPDTVNRIKMSSERHNTYLTILKLKDLSEKENAQIILRPYLKSEEKKKNEEKTSVECTFKINDEEVNTEKDTVFVFKTKANNKFKYEVTYKSDDDKITYESGPRHFSAASDETLWIPIGQKVIHKHEYLEPSDTGKQHKSKFDIVNPGDTYEIVSEKSDSDNITIYADDGVLIPGFVAWGYMVEGIEVKKNDSSGSKTEPNTKTLSGKVKLDKQAIVTHFYRSILSD